MLAVTPGNMVTAVAPDISVGGVVNEARFHGNTTMFRSENHFCWWRVRFSPMGPPYYYVGFFLIFAVCVCVCQSTSLSLSLSINFSICQCLYHIHIYQLLSTKFISSNFSLSNSAPFNLSTLYHHTLRGRGGFAWQARRLVTAVDLGAWPLGDWRGLWLSRW